MDKYAIQAMNMINEKLTSNLVNNDDLISTHRIDQRQDFTKVATKVVFSEKATKKLIEFLIKVLNTDFREYGTYFYGKLYDGFIYFDDFLSDFQLADGLFANGAVDVTDQNLHELELKTEKKYTSTPCNAVMHFHTHPDQVLDKNGNPFKPCSLFMSEQDLYSYGYHQLYLQPLSNNYVIFIGGMLSKNNNHPEFNIVYYNPYKKCFYNLNDIYLIRDEKLVKVDNSYFTNFNSLPKNIDDKTEAMILELVKKDSK